METRKQYEEALFKQGRFTIHETKTIVYPTPVCFSLEELVIWGKRIPRSNPNYRFENGLFICGNDVYDAETGLKLVMNGNDEYMKKMNSVLFTVGLRYIDKEEFYEVDPVLGTLTEINAKLPTPHGYFLCNYPKTRGEWTIHAISWNDKKEANMTYQHSRDGQVILVFLEFVSNDGLLLQTDVQGKTWSWWNENKEGTCYSRFTMDLRERDRYLSSLFLRLPVELQRLLSSFIS
jgi:hypothetical protein